MVTKIADMSFYQSITANQTQVLVTRFKKDFRSEVDSVRIVDQVALMTPENIHVNAFMYEPIVDMSDDHLRKLYQEVMTLS